MLRMDPLRTPVCMVCRGCPPHPLYPYNGGIRPIGCAGDAQGMHRGCTGDAPRGPPEDPISRVSRGLQHAHRVYVFIH